MLPEVLDLVYELITHSGVIEFVFLVRIRDVDRPEFTTVIFLELGEIAVHADVTDQGFPYDIVFLLVADFQACGVVAVFFQGDYTICCSDSLVGAELETFFPDIVAEIYLLAVQRAGLVGYLYFAVPGS